MNIVEKVKQFVEEECKKPTSKYGPEPYEYHFVQVHKYAKKLAGKLNADVEVVEIAALLHDIGSIICGRGNHHITGAKIAEEKLREFGYSEDKIKKVKHCIYTHRGSQKLERKTVEAQILADADTMSNYDNISGIFKAAFIYENLSQAQAQEAVKRKLMNNWNKITPEARELIRDKYEAVKVLF